MQEEYYRQRRAEHASPKHSFAGATKVGASWLKCGEPETRICSETDATQRCVGQRRGWDTERAMRRVLTGTDLPSAISTFWLLELERI